MLNRLKCPIKKCNASVKCVHCINTNKIKIIRSGVLILHCITNVLLITRNIRLCQHKEPNCYYISVGTFVNRRPFQILRAMADLLVRVRAYVSDVIASRFEKVGNDHRFENCAQIWEFGKGHRFENWTPIWEFKKKRTVIRDNDVNPCRFEEWRTIWVVTLVWIYHIYWCYAD
jgi:hypothetical protein